MVPRVSRWRALALLAIAASGGAWLFTAGARPCTSRKGIAVPEDLPHAPPGATPFPPEVGRKIASALAARPEGEVPRTRHRDGNVPRYVNRLALEASPYLRQHAHNPVNWYPWGRGGLRGGAPHRPAIVPLGRATPPATGAT